MDLQIKDQLFIIGGASSGFGKAITQALVNENARVIAIARGEEKLAELQSYKPNLIEIIVGDLAEEATLNKLLKIINGRQIHGMVRM